VSLDLISSGRGVAVELSGGGVGRERGWEEVAGGEGGAGAAKVGREGVEGGGGGGETEEEKV
jgi:hypothetical protein